MLLKIGPASNVVLNLLQFTKFCCRLEIYGYMKYEAMSIFA